VSTRAVFVSLHTFLSTTNNMQKFSIALSAWVFLALFTTGLMAQNPVKWSFTVAPAGGDQYDLVLTGNIDEGWYTYSQKLENDNGPIPTTLEFKEGTHYSKIGEAKESGDRFTKYDKVFDMNLTKFKHKAIFTQRVKVTDRSKPITGYVDYMVCNEEMCLPPKSVDFKFDIPAAAVTPAPAPAPNTPKTGTETPSTQGGGKQTTAAPATPAATPHTATAPPEGSAAEPTIAPPTNTPATAQGSTDTDVKGYFNSKRDIDASKVVATCDAGSAEEDQSSLWWVFFQGMLWGLGAVLTPCIFPMIPVTVGFFVKRSKDRATGLRNAFLYGFFIYAIYVALGVGITKVFGATALNEMSTNVIFNLIFFAVFLLFALSFFGFFEITLPSSWVNKSDQLAGKGGLIGIFFMAFTLALVSFSCTGPLVGTLLVETMRSNSGSEILGFLPARPFVGLSGFGLALALPFALFAMFPQWLNSLPKSGGWMDNVKMTLGFVELGLAFKFLSTADLVAHWNILKFELFMGIWLLCAALLALYQFGILGWKGAKGRPGPLRLGVGALSAAFALYLGYGLFNYQSLSLLSGLAPPVGYSWGRPSDCPNGLDCYHDFDEALAIAQKENKPLFVDFTGYGCVNCRKMEETVWHQNGVAERLRDDYVVVSLYVDDKKRLFPDDKFAHLLDEGTGDKIRTVGDKWSSFQINNFNRNSQPWYVLMHHDGKTVLNEPRGYTPEVAEYKAFLDCGVSAFKTMNNNPINAIGQAE
jgi:thiol:disulfide interchange protein